MALKARRRRARLSMTSLIDVIFLLLLFFMLSSTFSRFAEVELSAGGSGGAEGTPPQNILFLRLSDEALSLNGQPLEAAALRAAVEGTERPATALVSVSGAATAQALTNVLIALRGLPELTVTVLESS